MAYLSMVNTFSISSYHHTDVKTEPIDIYANFPFSCIVNVILLMSTVFSFLWGMTNIFYNPEFRLDWLFNNQKDGDPPNWYLHKERKISIFPFCDFWVGRKI